MRPIFRRTAHVAYPVDLVDADASYKTTRRNKMNKVASWPDGRNMFDPTATIIKLTPFGSRNSIVSPRWFADCPKTVTPDHQLHKNSSPRFRRFVDGMPPDSTKFIVLSAGWQLDLAGSFAQLRTFQLFLPNAKNWMGLQRLRETRSLRLLILNSLKLVPLFAIKVIDLRHEYQERIASSKLTDQVRLRRNSRLLPFLPYCRPKASPMQKISMTFFVESRSFTGVSETTKPRASWTNLVSNLPCFGAASHAAIETGA